MGMIQKLAFKATERGAKSTEFKAAAQRHANAFWLFAGIAGVVWYLWGWEWALIPIAGCILQIVQSATATMVADRLHGIEELFK